MRRAALLLACACIAAGAEAAGATAADPMTGADAAGAEAARADAAGATAADPMNLVRPAGEATRAERERRASAAHVFEGATVVSTAGKTQRRKEIVVTKSMCEAWGRDGQVLAKYPRRRKQIVAGAPPRPPRLLLNRCELPRLTATDVQLC